MAVPDIKQIIDAIYTTLNADATLKAALGDGVIYSGFNVSAKAARPYVLIRPPQGLADIGSKDLTLWQFDLEILVVTDETESSATMETIIDYVLEDLHRGTLSITDAHLLTECVGMTQVPSSDDLAAIVLNFQITISQ
jgi:hypothetical protein